MPGDCEWSFRSVTGGTPNPMQTFSDRFAVGFMNVIKEANNMKLLLDMLGIRHESVQLWALQTLKTFGCSFRVTSLDFSLTFPLTFHPDSLPLLM